MECSIIETSVPINSEMRLYFPKASLQGIEKKILETNSMEILKQNMGTLSK